MNSRRESDLVQPLRLPTRRYIEIPTEPPDMEDIESLGVRKLARNWIADPDKDMKDANYPCIPVWMRVRSVVFVG